jgi:hypothetical protein
MKKLRELTANYGHKDISELVKFVSEAEISLPGNEQYFFEKQGNVVHVYGQGQGITNYMAEMPINGVASSRKGIELDIKYGGVEKIILHSTPKMNQVQSWQSPSYGESQESRRNLISVVSSESRTSSESRPTRNYSSGGESRNGGESR